MDRRPVVRVADAGPSRRTFAIAVGGLVLIGLVAIAGLSAAHGVGAADASARVSLLTHLGSVVLGIVAAAAMLRVGSHVRPGNPLRRIWVLFGAGMVAYVAGDVIWAALIAGEGSQAAAHPLVADAFYLVMYAFLISGLTLTAIAFGRAARVRTPMLAGIVVAVLAAIAVFGLVCLPILSASTVSITAKVLGVAYPMADVLLLAGPAAFVLLAVPSIGSFGVTRQWWLLGIGLMVMSLSDIGLVWIRSTGGYFSGHWVDFAWMAGLLLVAVAGSLAADAAECHECEDAPADSLVEVYGKYADALLADLGDDERGLVYTVPGGTVDARD
jgi:hypothetical protein